MLKSCHRCGRIHDRKYQCGPKRYYKPKTSELDKFRSSGAWQRKRKQIRDRDLNLCVWCRNLSPPKYTTNGLSVHHIIPLEEDFDKRLDDGYLITLCSEHHDKAERGVISRSKLLDLVHEE